MNKKELIDKQVEITERLQLEKNRVKKSEEELDRISTQISELKEQQDYGSFRFVHQNIHTILQKIAPKHKLPPPRDLDLPLTSMTASIPWTENKCSDEDPCNINICPRCTLIHFKNVVGGLLASYYSK
jgi:hypothetical protein